ncbi:hypothetical protein B6V73_00855 [Thioclava sp. JM3]|uniref:hypothetical protein n=1 Tax=unclassified Thioclava TaxID=2621713 RepID=UPI000B53D2BC|nr:MULTISPECIES: hypothetical protein [unclassified Thioclava]OWY09036.1 hypothetical protein B6V74_10310 [Thioclava sp. F42-5]OWY18388.1 hypothetical protein B6V73_00855 [Thioclava sp. JM3]
MRQYARQLPVRDITACVGRELETLARLSVSLQKTLSASGIDGDLSPHIVRELQSIDFLSQSLEDLGQFVNKLSEQISPDLACDADTVFASLRLQDLAAALDPEHFAEFQKRATDGDVSWF